MVTVPGSETANTASLLQFTGILSSIVSPARNSAHRSRDATGFSARTQNTEVVADILTRPRRIFAPEVLVLVFADIDCDAI
jgi:hypothetical protein